MKKFLLTAGALLALCACSPKPAFDPDMHFEQLSLVPYPNDITLQEGAYNLQGAPLRVDPAIGEDSRTVIDEFVAQIELVGGKTLPQGDGGLQFILNSNLAPEQYALQVDAEGVRLEAAALGGFLYGLQTLKELLPTAIYAGQKSPDPLWVPAVSILDQPRFAYRGMHMDTSRHFWPVEEVKRYLDIMAAFKLNRLHFHLTDDQGWRIESKQYPLLTEVSAWRDGTVIKKDFSSSDGIRYGGFYTQEQLREIVAYAAARNITVIPEIDLPGHMVAVLAAYPELGCTGGPYAVWQRWGVAKDILCAGNEAVFTFLENVLTEVMDIFPSEYIHIGGDECFGGDAEPDRPDPWDVCPKCLARERELGIKPGPEAKHYLQNYVTARVQDFLAQHGRKIIGWDEILQGELAPGATVMSWRGTAGGIKAASLGFDAIMTPTDYCYFDFYQGQERDKEPFGIGGYLPLEKVYGYEPLAEIPEGAEEHILGVQSNLWTEYISTPEHLEYMLLPRMCALSETQWCDRGRKDFDRFNASLDHIFDMLDVLGYNYSLDIRGQVGLDRIPARSEEELSDYLSKKDWLW